MTGVRGGGHAGGPADVCAGGGWAATRACIRAPMFLHHSKIWKKYNVAFTLKSLETPILGY